MKLLISLLFISLAFMAKSTHNRGGEITYTHISGNTYQFTITTCTKTSAPADRSELDINWGDGTGSDTVQRSNIVSIPGEDAQKNIYIINHTFAGAGTFRVTMEDPNRNGGIVNIGGASNSDQFPFCIATEVVISPFIGPNNSVVFNDCPCPEFACINKRYCYNSQATDPDGDSLSYSLVPCLGLGCNPMATPAVYLYPDNFGGTISIDPVTGTMCWVNPTRLGEFNIAILVEEWRSGVRVGSVLRDMQLTVENCLNDPPVINTISDTCIVSGDILTFSVSATDPNVGDRITLTGNGGVFNGTNPAVFPSATSLSPVSSTFTWNTSCDNIRQAPYKVFFEAKDDGTPVNLSDYRQVNIIVKAPAPTGVIATPLSGRVNILWNSSSCTNSIGYKIYRKRGALGSTQDCCSGQSPINLGYNLIGQTNSINDTSFVDASVLAVGEEYCYAITAIFPINYESCLSTESCVKLIKDVPIITNVTVNTTNSSSGIDSIVWAKASELDTLVNYPPPYLYKVYHNNGFTGANTLIHTSPVYAQLYLSDTTYVYSSVNTESTPNNYKVEMYHIVGPDTLLVGATNSASSVFLSTVPNDNQITLNWTETVPWTNLNYEVYRGNSIGGIFTLIGSTTSQSYTDTNLINGATYCYKVRSIGQYSDPSLVNPIENFSQEVCDSPIDLTPPCPPILTVDNDCVDELNYLSWTNPNNSCADDVTRYRIFYSPTVGGTFIEIGTKNDPTDTTFDHNFFGSIAGCYYITALDSIQYNNESVPSNIVCVDNCPIYFLPNVFSPDGDGINDFFTPILPYKFVDSIEFVIYNRWGKEVYRTSDPDLGWDGNDQETGLPVSEGVYFYVCRVYSIRLDGLDETNLKGSISIFRGVGRQN